MKQRTIRPGQILLLLAIALVHVSAWFAYYGDLPAGTHPTDEARATLDAAQAIASGISHPDHNDSEISLYTYLLSIVARFSETQSDLVTAARALNALALLWITGACASTAARYWQSNRAVWIAGMLTSLNPVLVFWAAEVGPALLAAAFISSAVGRLLLWFKTTKASESFIIAICFTFACALQTALLPLALLSPLLACFYPLDRKMAHVGLTALPPLILIALIALTNLSLQTPWQWASGPVVDQAYAAYSALANQEPPQGKSFALYRELHLILLLNPIHWGGIFILSTIGFYARLREHPASPSVLAGVGILLLFGLSSAFTAGESPARVSLIPLVAIFGAGAYQMPRLWRHSNNKRRLRLTAAALLLSVFSYASAFTTNPSKKWENDYVYLARAHLAMDQHTQATTWAERALELNPERLDMKEVLVMAQFNDWALGGQPRTLPTETTRELLQATERVQNKSTLRTIRAIYQYKLRRTEIALAQWRAEKSVCPLALLCLYWTGSIQKPDIAELSAYSASPYYALLRDALHVDRNRLNYTDLAKQIDNLLALAY